MHHRQFLIGHPLGHSWSPALHTALGCADYALKDLLPEELEGWMCSSEWDGCNVTIPYKQAVMPYCAELSETARRIGSVNTLVRRADGSIFGDNTDIFGFEAMAARAGISFSGKKALVLGSGGTSHTVCDAVLRAGGTPVVISRSGENNYDNILEKHADADLILNTTPVGMWPHIAEQPVDLCGFQHLSGVLDVVYNPPRTRLLLQAEKLGIPCAGGLYMLCGQAAKAHELWTGEAADRETIDKMYADILNQHRNVVLIGMPGCGKSTIGRLLGEALNLPFLDADAEIVKKIGTDIPSFFQAQGEAAFRDVESEVIKELMTTGGRVIATGGGAILRQENRDLIRGFGRVIRLARPLADLATKGRPVTQQKGVEAIAKEREPFYAACADITFENSCPKEETLQTLLRLLKN